MAASHLTAVPSTIEPANLGGEFHNLGREVETSGQRIRRLQNEARALAREQIEIFARDLNALALRAAEIAVGGEVYPVGARELASRMADDLPQKALLLAAITNRSAMS